MAADRSLHIPVDLELTDGVRMLASVSGEPDFAALHVLRLWVDWARQGKEWRPLLNHAGEDIIHWGAESLASLIETACGYSAGGLVAHFVACRILRVEKRDDELGLVLPGFAELNPHLLPGYRSMHEKGGDAKAAKARLKQVAGAVEQTHEICRMKNVSLFDDATISEEDQKMALHLVMQLDAACDRNLRNPSEYTGQQALMKSALYRVRRHTSDEIERLLQSLIQSVRKKRLVGADAETVLRDFDKYLGFSKPATEL